MILEKLCRSNYRPVLIITAPDKPVGRKQILTPPPVKVAAQKYGIPVLQPKKILDSRSQILDYKPEVKNSKQTEKQLALYALAFMKRIRISSTDITCAYFKENGYYQFAFKI